MPLVYQPRPSTGAGSDLPLPTGEGWGEGEGTDRQPAAHYSVAPSCTQLHQNIFVSVTNAFSPGESVEVIGAALSDSTFTNLHFTVLGEQAVPTPKRLALSQLANDHGQWIETSGRVLSGETSRGRLAILLHDKGQNCLIYV